MMTTKTSLAIRYHECGEPAQVLRADTLEVPFPGVGQVRVRCLAACVNPSDYGMITGTYGKKKALPAVAGREGVGVIESVGEGVSGIQVGQRVRMPEEAGVWQQYCLADAATLCLVPSDLPLEMAAMAFVNPPTALRLLRDFVALKPGDWIVQNAASSAVGFCVIRLARKLGLRTLNVVRDASWEPWLKEAGADVVVTEDSGYEKDVRQRIGDGNVRLALNSVGGESVIRLVRVTADGGTVVTFGGMVGDAVRFPTRNLIFNDVRLVGFWMDRWLRVQGREQVRACFEEVFGLIRDGTFVVPVEARFPLAQAVEAVARSRMGGRRGKVLLCEADG